MKPESIEKLTLAKMRHMSFGELIKHDLSELNLLLEEANAALLTAKELNSRELVFNVKMAISWIKCALRVKRMKSEGGEA